MHQNYSRTSSACSCFNFCISEHKFLTCTWICWNPNPGSIPRFHEVAVLPRALLLGLRSSAVTKPILDIVLVMRWTKHGAVHPSGSCWPHELWFLTFDPETIGSHHKPLWSLWIPRPTTILVLANWTPFLILCGCTLSALLGWCLNTSYTMLALSPAVCWLRQLSWYYHLWSDACSIMNSTKTKTFPITAYSFEY